MTNRFNAFDGMSALEIILIIIILAIILIFGIPTFDEKGPWFIGCVDTVSGQQYLLKADQKPVLRDGFIIIGKETFITPRPMMTCRVVSEEELTSGNDGDML